MPPKKSKTTPSSSSSKKPTNPTADDAPPMPTDDLNPYQVLQIPPTASASEIRSAYLKLALTHHPDKAPPHLQESAHLAFQRLAFAYGILKDPSKKARYDATGSIHDSGSDFVDWGKFYKEMYSEPITVERIKEFKSKYQGSEEEREDVLKAYVKCKGSLMAMFGWVMCSDETEEEDVRRFERIVEEGIESGEVERLGKWGEKGKVRQVRQKREGEGRAAMAYAKKLGVYDALFGGAKGKAGDIEAPEEEEEEVEEDEDDDGEVEVSGDDSGDEEDLGAEDDDEDGDDFIENDEMEEEEEEDETSTATNGKSKHKTSPTQSPPPPTSTRTTRTKSKSKSSQPSPPSPPPPPTTKLQAKSKSKAPPSSASSSSAPAKPAAKAKAPRKPRSPSPEPDLDALRNLIQNRQKDRFANMISSIEDRYVNRQPAGGVGGSGSGKRGKNRNGNNKRDADELEDEVMGDAPPMPSEEEFLRTRRGLEERKAGKEEAGGQKKRRGGRK